MVLHHIQNHFSDFYMKEMNKSQKRVDFCAYFEDDWRVDQTDSEVYKKDDEFVFEPSRKEQRSFKQLPRLTVKIQNEYEIKKEGYLDK